MKTCWPPVQIVKVIDNEIRIVNNTSNPIHIPKNEQLCQIRSTHIVSNNKVSGPSAPKPLKTSGSNVFSNEIIIDPSKHLSSEWHRAFKDLHQQYDSVFEPIIGRYNGFAGKLKARISFGSAVPPPRKLHAPSYSRDNLQILQDKFDELESQNVFGRPEDYGVTVEHVSPSFLVKKPSPGFRLVTAFTSLGEFTKTLPTIMPTVEVMFRTISEWKFLIKTDLKDAFYQIPLAKESMRWCGTVTPFRGLRIYLVASQGLPGSSEWLEELLCLLFGEKVQEGWVAKVADDLYVGAMTIEDLFKNWSEVLDILLKNGLKLKGPKTVIAPVHTQLLGWDWNNGTITASSHKLLPLTKCEPPTTVTNMRSFIGSYKFFNRVIRGCALHLDPLEKFITGKSKNEKLIWTDNSLSDFNAAQKALSTASVITLPKRSDQLIIVHDGSHVGIGSVLYLNRNDVLKLGGYFSAKLKAHQVRWLPCEVEALSIGVSVTHFGPFIRESVNRTQILTDNRPCVQAWSKMRKGEFSTSARVATFMSSLSEFNLEVQHISGAYNLPSDFLSRNPLSCISKDCQLCKFIEESENCVVRSVSVQDVLSGHHAVPFSNRTAWKNLQMECPDLRRVHAHLVNGTRPSAKKTKVNLVKRFLRNVTVAKDGLLIVKQSQPFLPDSDLIVIPIHLLLGLLTSLHIILNHPTAHQITNVFNRCYFSLNTSDAVSKVTKSCSQCLSLETMPKELFPQTSSVPTTTPLSEYAADCMHRCRQIIFVIRDTFSSFTIAQLISDEKHGTLRSALVVSVSSIRPNPQTLVNVRVDNNTGFVKLKGDKDLAAHKINVTLGRIHNKNKIPTVDKAIRELSSEILRLYPEGGAISDSQLAVAVNQLNSRIRNRGLSAWEILNQRNQFTGEQFDINDLKLSEEQNQIRAANQLYSAKHKAGGKGVARSASVAKGSLIYIKSEGDKHTVRSRYIVVDVFDDSCTVQKLAKSNLRSKKYQLKLSEVYLVQPENIEIEGNIRDLDVSDAMDNELYEENHIPNDLAVLPPNNLSGEGIDHIINEELTSGGMMPSDQPGINNPDSVIPDSGVSDVSVPNAEVVASVDVPGVVAVPYSDTRPKRVAKKKEDPNFVYYGLRR